MLKRIRKPANQTQSQKTFRIVTVNALIEYANCIVQIIVDIHGQSWL